MEYLPIFPFGLSGIYRNPAKGATHTTGLSPVEPCLLKLFSASHILSSDALQRLTMQSQFFPRPFGVGVYVIGRQKHAPFFNRTGTSVH